jgi:hypothetical protein
MNPLVAIALVVGAIGVISKLFKTDEKRVEREVETPRAFISFDFDNNLNQKILFAGQCNKRSPTPFAAQDWSSKEALPQAEWQRLIREKIGRCHMMFVLVSPTAHHASGIEKEIAMASEQRVPLIGVYVAGANSSTILPKGLARDRAYEWQWKLLASAIEKMLKEGKNVRS